jgi:3-oxoacyl-[acyl-carrier-protein] synthase II
MRRVVVTGTGAVTPIGLSASTTWASMLAARSGIGPIGSFDATGWAVQVAGEVTGFDPVARMGRKTARRSDRFCHFAVSAGIEAWESAGLDDSELDPERVGVYVGSGIGGVHELFSGHDWVQANGPRRLSPFMIPKTLTNVGAGHLAERFNAQGPSLCVTTACATGNHNLGEAFRAIQGDWADVILAGGAEAPLHPTGVAGFMVMKALSKRADSTASRPFDADRDGFVISEGAGILALEELEHAKARGAPILAEMVGYASNNDAFHVTAPSPGGRGAARCMELALKRARIRPDQVGYVNAHGTSTQANDRAETSALHRCFGDHARSLWVSSTKGVTGHLLGAAGGVEALATVLALRDQVAPPTAHLSTPDPECDLDYVPNHARPGPIDVALSNSFGFGGTNATLVFRRWAG